VLGPRDILLMCVYLAREGERRWELATFLSLRIARSILYTSNANQQTSYELSGSTAHSLWPPNAFEIRADKVQGRDRMGGSLLTRCRAIGDLCLR